VLIPAWEIFNYEFVSDFDIRISDFNASDLAGHQTRLKMLDVGG